MKKSIILILTSLVEPCPCLAVKPPYAGCKSYPAKQMGRFHAFRRSQCDHSKSII